MSIARYGEFVSQITDSSSPLGSSWRSPLHDRHVGLGAKLTDFGGWWMPIEYPAGAGSGRPGGVMREHAAVRERVGLFDVSHLGKATVVGPGAAAYVNRCFTNDLARIDPGQAQYTTCCNDQGGVVDDLIQYLISQDEVFLIPNAANTAEVVRRLADHAPVGVEVRDAHQAYAVLAVQGPASVDVLASLGIPADLAYMSFVRTERCAAGHEPIPMTVCRTGYTGEVGFELIPPWERAGELWDVLMAAVIEHGGLPCGLGSRDTLRTEMGYALHGHELSTSITPVQAKLGWAVGWEKPAFWGKEALVAEKAAGPTRAAWGLLAEGKGVPRAGCSVLAEDESSVRVVGELTSGTFSPTLKRGIALALLDTAAGLKAGDRVRIDVRGRSLPATVTKPPFVDVGVRGSARR